MGSSIETIRNKLNEIKIAFPIIVSILTIGVAVVLAEVRSKVGWMPILMSLACFVAIYSISLIIIGWYYRPLCVGLLEDVRDTITGIVDPNNLGIIDNEGLTMIEASRSDKEIWLITGDLAEDVPGSVFYDVVHKNLNKGIRYVYFCPKSFKNQGRVATITQAHGTTKGEIDFIFLPDDFFFLTPRLDFCIYDPYNTTGMRCGYMGLPMDTEKHLHGSMDKELLDSLVGKLSTYSEKGE